MFSFSGRIFLSILFLCIQPLFAQKVEILINHLGYEFDQAKKCIIKIENAENLGIDKFELIDLQSGKSVYSGELNKPQKVANWKNWNFLAGNFSDFSAKGKYVIKVNYLDTLALSYPFEIEENLLQKKTLSDVLYYFKGQRSSGLYDKADAQSSLTGNKDVEIDVHGGWYDATGDYGKHLSHLTFSTYFNPQQTSLTVWSLFKSYEELEKKEIKDFRQFKRRMLDEAMYGADFLVRMHVENGSFYRSVSAPGPNKLPEDREIQPEPGDYTIKESKEETFSRSKDGSKWRSFQTSYRSGAGMSIAALAVAASFDVSGDFSNSKYLEVAEKAFDFLEKENKLMTNNGTENILDDYTALCAASALYKTTKKDVYLFAANKRAKSLIDRLSSWQTYQNYWRADHTDRPFFHPSDAGLPIISLLEFYPIAPHSLQAEIKETVKKSLDFEFKITKEVANPFEYSRQLVQDKEGNRRSAFFFPHNSEAAPWWQGENARLGSLASAAFKAREIFNENPNLQQELNAFATNQLNWILGLNPYNCSMLEGSGYNNAQYEFFGTFEYTNAPGGIINGITSGFDDETGIDFNLSYKKTGKDNDWRWLEQWLPHAAWYLYAISLQ